MIIQIASDLHLEIVRRFRPDDRLIKPAKDADLLILAGDISCGTSALSIFSDWPVPVLYVLGNHEYYGHEFFSLREEAKLMSANGKGSVILLENEVADFSRFAWWSSKHAEKLSSIRFLGATLWTNYNHPESLISHEEQMDVAYNEINDHYEIGYGGESFPFKPSNALHEHNNSIKWLRSEIERPFEGKTVVISHHAPHIGSTHQRYRGDHCSGAFVSHLPDIVKHADIWVHGHTHDSYDYIAEEQARIIANPRGYGRGFWYGSSEVEWENDLFKPDFTIEV